jgi:hypothetical protein
MGLAILGSSSENKTQTRTDNITKNVTGGVQDGGWNLSTSESQISIVDGGAIASMAKIAFKALENEEKFGTNALDKSLAAVERSGSDAFKFAADAGRPEAALWTKQIYVMGAIAVAVVIAMSMQKNKPKGKQ